MKKLLTIILTIICVTCFSLFFVGCNNNDNNNANNDDQIVAIYNTYVVYAQENGQTPLSYEDWLASIKGEKGDKGDTGANGKDGATPTIEIKEGYWYINGENTGVKAEGKDGTNGTNGTNGKGIKSAVIDTNGDLIITYDDGTSINAGNVVVKNPTLDENNKIVFKTLNVDGTDVYGKVANGTQYFSFIDEVELVGNAGYTVSTDIYGNDIISNKIVSLNVGDNTFYIREECGNAINVYTVVIRKLACGNF